MKRLSVLPLATYAVIIAYAYYGAAVAGHWPYYSHPDPKDLPLRALGYVASVFFLIGVLSVILIPAGYLVWRLAAFWTKRPVLPHLRAVLFFCAGSVLWVLDFAAIHTDLPWTSQISWLLD